jgi:hypothetical protein
MNEEFYYRVGNVETRTPWLKPTFERMQSFLKDLSDTTDILDRNELYVWGGILFDYDTWDIDMFFTGKYPDINQLESDLSLMYDKALNKHNLLIDSYWTLRKPKLLSYVEAKENDFKIERDVSIKFSKIEKIDTRNGQNQKIIRDLSGGHNKVSENLIELKFTGVLPNKFRYNPRYAEYVFKDPILAKDIIKNDKEWFDKVK